MSTNILSIVRQRLDEDFGRLRLVAEKTGIPYDTILRIKNGEGDPGFSKVHRLASYYSVGARKPAKAA